MSRFQSFTGQSDEPIFKPNIVGEGNPEDGGDEENAPQQPDKTDALEQKFGQMLESLSQGQAVNKLLQDPNVAAYIQAQQQGKKVKLVEDQPAAAAPEPEGNPEEMTNSELADFMMKKFSTRMGTQMEQMLQKIVGPIEGQVKQLSVLAESMRGSGIQNEIKVAQQKYPDFDVYRKSMGELAAKAGDGVFSVDQLYKMAKALQGDDPERPGNPSSERPNNFAARMQSKQPRQPTQASNGQPNKGLANEFRGRSGFKNMLATYLNSQE